MPPKIPNLPAPNPELMNWSGSAQASSRQSSSSSTPHTVKRGTAPRSVAARGAPFYPVLVATNPDADDAGTQTPNRSQHPKKNFRDRRQSVSKESGVIRHGSQGRHAIPFALQREIDSSERKGSLSDSGSIFELRTSDADRRLAWLGGVDGDLELVLDPALDLEEGEGLGIGGVRHDKAWTMPSSARLDHKATLHSDALADLRVPGASGLDDSTRYLTPMRGHMPMRLAAHGGVQPSPTSLGGGHILSKEQVAHITHMVSALQAAVHEMSEERAGRVARALGPGVCASVLAEGVPQMLSRARMRDRSRILFQGVVGNISFFVGGMVQLSLRKALRDDDFSRVMGLLLTCLSIASVGVLVTRVGRRAPMGAQYSEHAKDHPTPTGSTARDRGDDAAWLSYFAAHALVDFFAPLADALYWRTVASAPVAGCVTAAGHALNDVPISSPAKYPWLDTGDAMLEDAKRTRHFDTATQRLHHAIAALQQDSIDASAGYVADFFHGLKDSLGIPDGHAIAETAARTSVFVGMLGPRLAVPHFRKLEQQRHVFNVGSDLLLSSWGWWRRQIQRCLSRKNSAGQPVYPFTRNPAPSPARTDAATPAGGITLAPSSPVKSSTRVSLVDPGVVSGAPERIALDGVSRGGALPRTSAYTVSHGVPDLLRQLPPADPAQSGAGQDN